MKSIRVFLSAAILFLVVVTLHAQDLGSSLEKLSKQYDFTFEKMKTDSSLFPEKYMLYITQPVDHYDPDGKKFVQRVILSHKSFDKPVVFVTEGYSAAYAENPKYVNELSDYLDANQIVVEHRYFNKSVPDTLDWDYLTVFNAASDHHRVVEILKKLYPKKWLNTGISKGGQTAVYHRYFYPEDVDATVGYVCPFNFSKEDKRAYVFLGTVGSDQCRQNIYEFQSELLKNKDKYLPGFKKLAKKKKLTYRMGVEKGFELTVFEFSFAFWQWGAFSCDSIPRAENTSPKKMIAFLDKVAGLKWISDQGIEGGMQPFFIQAMKELGMYGYNVEPFKKWTTYQHNVSFEFTIPKGVTINYSPDLMEKVDFFIRHQAHNMILIYGGADAWSFAAGEPTLHTNSFRIVKPGGSHRTRISNLPEFQRERVLDSLKVWMKDE
jgi:hypothetical protein